MHQILLQIHAYSNKSGRQASNPTIPAQGDIELLVSCFLNFCTYFQHFSDSNNVKSFSFHQLTTLLYEFFVQLIPILSGPKTDPYGRLIPEPELYDVDLIEKIFCVRWSTHASKTTRCMCADSRLYA